MELFEQKLRAMTARNFYLRAELPVQVDLIKAFALGWQEAGGEMEIVRDFGARLTRLLKYFEEEDENKEE